MGLDGDKGDIGNPGEQVLISVTSESKTKGQDV